MIRLNNSLDGLIDDYLKSLMSDYRSCSENTIKSIKSDLSRFLAYGTARKSVRRESFYRGFVLST